jgi:hypothetical protein
VRTPDGLQRVEIVVDVKRAVEHVICTAKAR